MVYWLGDSELETGYTHLGVQVFVLDAGPPREKQIRGMIMAGR